MNLTMTLTMNLTTCLDLTTLLTTSRFRGTGTYCLGLLRGMAEARDEVRRLGLRFLVGPARSPRLVDLDEATRWATGPALGEPVLGDGAYWALKHTAARARLALGRHRPAVYHSPEPVGTPRPPGARLLVTCHDLIPIVLRYPIAWGGLDARLRIPLERARFVGVDHVLCISEQTRADLERVVGVPRERTTLIHHGVDDRLFCADPLPDDAARAREVTGSARPFLLYLGGFDERKQVPRTVEAFARCAADVDQDLLVCGKMAPEMERTLRGLLRHHGLERRVLLPGFVPLRNTAALYRRATAHVMLSTYEGFGMTVTEAMACGCPVIAARASCVPEIAGDAALLVPPGDTDAAAAAMVRVCRDPDLRADLVARGLARAARFTWERCAQETLALYRRVHAHR